MGIIREPWLSYWNSLYLVHQGIWRQENILRQNVTLFLESNPLGNHVKDGLNEKKNLEQRSQIGGCSR